MSSRSVTSAGVSVPVSCRTSSGGWQTFLAFVWLLRPLNIACRFGWSLGRARRLAALFSAHGTHHSRNKTREGEMGPNIPGILYEDEGGGGSLRRARWAAAESATRQHPLLVPAKLLGLTARWPAGTGFSGNGCCLDPARRAGWAQVSLCSHHLVP